MHYSCLGRCKWKPFTRKGWNKKVSCGWKLHWRESLNQALGLSLRTSKQSPKYVGENSTESKQKLNTFYLQTGFGCILNILNIFLAIQVTLWTKSCKEPHVGAGNKVYKWIQVDKASGPSQNSSVALAASWMEALASKPHKSMETRWNKSNNLQWSIKYVSNYDENTCSWNLAESSSDMNHS